MVSTNLHLPMDSIADLCKKYEVEELSIFGSILRDDIRPESDIDFLVVFRNNDAGPWMSKFTELEEDLAGVLGRKVDLVDKLGIQQSRNWIRRDAILNSATVIYGS